MSYQFVIILSRENEKDATRNRSTMRLCGNGDSKSKQGV